MDTVLVINCGSSSLKWTLLDMADQQALARGLVERIGEAEPSQRYSLGDQAFKASAPGASDHDGALRTVLEVLQAGGATNPALSAPPLCVGHRVVHGAARFTQPVLIDAAVKDEIRACVALAPLHNPANLVGIEACERLLPGIPQVAVFDTAFHQTMPEQAYLYALPLELAREHGLRRYGFHGISHQFVSERAAAHLGEGARRVVTCHLGNGASVTAVKDGRSVDTSMGLTPLEGLVMGTRAGDIDPGLLLHMGRTLGLDYDALDTLLNRKSGMKGLSGISNDLREIEDAALAGDARAELALDIYAYRVRKYVGAYAAAMEGVDAIVFTAGVGEHSPIVRGKVCRALGFLGVELDEERNEAKATHSAPVTDIASGASRVRVLVIPTNEEGMIAREAFRVVQG